MFLRMYVDLYVYVLLTDKTISDKLLLKQRPNSYKVGVVFATYKITRAKETSWAGPRHESTTTNTMVGSKYGV